MQYLCDGYNHVALHPAGLSTLRNEITLYIMTSQHTMRNNMSGLVKVSKRTAIWGWVVLITGIISLFSPFVFGVAISILVGGLLAVAGIARLMDALQGGGFWSGIFGAMSTVAGLVIMGRPLLGLATLTLVLAVFFLATGISGVIAAIQIRPRQGWGLLLLSGIISAVLAMMIWNQWPLSGRWAVGILVGVQLIFSGMTMIRIGSATRKMEEKTGAG